MKWFSVRDLQSAEIEEEVRESAALAIQELSEVNDLGLRTQDLELKKTVVLLSGGLDSATALYWAMSKGFSCRALSVRYGQRHFRELESARQVAEKAGVPFEEVSLDLAWFKDSTLVDSHKSLPDNPLEKIGKDGIPSTYVPGRNTLFLSLAVSLADSTGGDSIVIGANILDYSGYPDCRPEFYRAYEEAAKFGTKSGVEGVRIAILTPLIKMTKAQIVRLATELRVPLELTWSCYAGGERPCGKCDSCKLRAKGFEEAGVSDPALEMV
ncbi:MAG: 7-cyano-7-deazaguanine synthase QueC [Elusimicrobia bacterium]|nr:7-cyano-7-deazaguanine synthase QueC [Elusimicrobiota bacterium]